MLSEDATEVYESYDFVLESESEREVRVGRAELYWLMGVYW